jgi:retron-type reverse transcriptase
VFTNFSHGFRPSKGCHSALNQVRIQFNHCRWVIESDICKCFDTIDHDIFLKIINKKIQCQKTIKLLESALKAGYLESIGESIIRNVKGIPQGSILSPLLCNIYLHEMDTYIQKQMAFFCKGTNRKINPIYKKANKKLHELNPGSKEWKAARTYIRSIPSKNNMDPSFKRIYYVRYADDFIIGIQGSKAEATTIMKSLDDWLQANLKLILHPNKTKICHFRSESTVFLGIRIGP